MFRDIRIESCLFALCLVLCGGLLGIAFAVEFPEDHPALRLYPSPEELQRQIDEIKRSDPQGWAAARADFDLAVRAGAMCAESRPVNMHVSRRPVSTPTVCFEIETRKMMADYLRELDLREDGRPLVAWYREHLEEFVVEDTATLRLVLLDAILNRWDEWSAWNGDERLDALRKECPDPHRLCAWNLAAPLHMFELSGVALRRLLVAHEPDADYNVLPMSLLVGDVTDVAVVDFLLKGVATIPEGTNSRAFATACQLLPRTGQTVAFRDLWAEYLTSESARVRRQAAIHTGSAIEWIRVETKGQDNSEGLQAKLRQLADSDSDQYVRTEAMKSLERIRAAQWRGDP
ncbi:MAG: hypothetical protein IT449_15300 [Phycisphaerales bacterium]|nr:hypothetical protein [Phycisphaerales bacterium]